MNAIPAFLRPLAGAALERALNRALSMDAAAAGRVRGWQGRRIAFKLVNPPLALQLTVTPDGKLQVGKLESDIEHDLEIDSNLTGLINQSPMMREAPNKLKGRLRISGDADLAREVQGLMANFAPDLQLPFVQLFGDVMGVQVAQAVSGAGRHLREAGRSLAESSALFVTEESRDVVGRIELQDFHDAVDTVRNDVERLAVRIARLRAERGL